MEVLRGTLYSRSTGIFFALALLSGGDASLSVAAGETPVILAMGPGLPSSEKRPTPTLPRYFTINEVLARRDSQTVNTAAQGQSVQVAAREVSAPTTAPAPLPTYGTLQNDEPFGLATFRAPEGLLWTKWRKLIAEMAAEAQVLSHCKADPAGCPSPAAQKFLHLIEESLKLPALAKIDRINRAINAAVRYTSDQDQHGVPDLWTAPLATLSSGQGDCEDYAIAKYVALREAGISRDDLRLLLVHDRVAHQDHAVVGVRQKGRWVMLDNRHDVLIEQKDAWHFTPLFALDQQGVKLFAAPYGNPPVTAPTLVATGPANSAHTPPPSDLDGTGSAAPELRLDTFEPPALRGRM